nr:hypothetical protein [Microbacterium bovistercoris]
MDVATETALLLTRERPAEVERLDRDGSLHRVRPGAYVRRSEWAPLAPWERYAVRIEAVARTWSAPVFCLESACAPHGLPLFGEPRDIHLLSPDGRSWREGDVVVHGTRDERSTVTVDGLTVTSLQDTAVDLCRVLPPAFALAVADRVLRLLAPNDETLAVGEHGRRQSNRRGLRQLDWVQDRATALAESAGESLSRAVAEWLGYEEPELQVGFAYEGARDRVDFYWRRLRRIGESDGYGKYDANDPAAMKAHFVVEKTREDRLRRHEGGFIRWEWADAIRWRSLDQKLALGGLERIRPRQLAMLATLAANPRSLPVKQADTGASAASRRRGKGSSARPSEMRRVSR